MIARLLLLTALLITAAVFQTALLPAVGITGIRPDLLLLVVIAVALHDGALGGLRVGFAAGLLTDLLVLQAPAGLAALVWATVGFAVGSARPYLASDSLSAPILIAFASALLATFGYGVLTLLLGEERGSPTLLFQGSVGVAVATTLVAPVVLPVVRRLLDRHPPRGAAVDEDD